MFWEGLPRSIIEGASALQSGRIKSSSESCGVLLLPLAAPQPESTLSTALGKKSKSEIWMIFLEREKKIERRIPKIF